MQTKYENKAQPAPKFTRVDLRVSGLPIGYVSGKRGNGIADQVRLFCEQTFGKGKLIRLGTRSFDWITNGSDQQAVPDQESDRGAG